MTHLPIAVAYFFFLGFWLQLIHRSDAPSLHPIHPLMSRLLLVKALTSLTSPVHPRDDPLTLSVRILLVLALTLLLVEITRASLAPLRPNVSKKATTAVIVAQIVANVAVGEVEGVTRSAIMAYMLVNMIGGFSVLGCLLWHLSQLREELKGAKKQVGRRAVDRVRIFLERYMGVLALSYATKMLSSPLGSSNGSVEEIVGMAFYAAMFCWFRPKAVNSSEYFITAEEEETQQLIP